MRISSINKPVVFITMGDPSGIGPEIIMRSMASPEIKGLAVFVVIGDKRTMERAWSVLPASARDLCRVDRILKYDRAMLSEDVVNIFDPSPGLADTGPGFPTEEGARKALACLDAAVGFMKDVSAGHSAMVTAPLSKERIAGIKKGFIGHTEYLQKAFSSDFVTMVLKGDKLCVVPVTRHIPIREVASSLDRSKIEKTLVQVADNRSLLAGCDHARIGVTGLNPHCGEGGKIGKEEAEIIAPAIAGAQRHYARIEGPISADIIFGKALKGEIDIVVSMYHDQGLGPFKTVDFASGVNITLGLGQVRTSPDHGTAFDIAGKGIACPRSMEAAIKMAVKAAAAQRQ